MRMLGGTLAAPVVGNLCPKRSLDGELRLHSSGRRAGQHQAGNHAQAVLEDLLSLLECGMAE